MTTPTIRRNVTAMIPPAVVCTAGRANRAKVRAVTAVPQAIHARVHPESFHKGRNQRVHRDVPATGMAMNDHPIATGLQPRICFASRVNRTMNPMNWYPVLNAAYM